MIIDSHQHFWNYEPEKHLWIDDEMSVIRRDFLSDDLHKVFAEKGVDACVAVQADQTTEETNFLISIAENNNFIKGVVGWVNLRSESIEEDLLKYKK